MRASVLAIIGVAAASLSACGGSVKRTPITPAALPLELARMRNAERSVRVPLGTEIVWSTDGSAAAVIDGGIGRVNVFATRAGGTNVNERDIALLFKRSLERPSGPIMREGEPPGPEIWCQESEPIQSSGPPLRFAACVRVDEETRRNGVMTLAVFGTTAQHFVPLGGARLAAEVLRSARGFKPAPQKRR
jgi:hypothetical protein